MTAWYEDDQFWQIFYPAMFGEARWQAAGEEVDGALDTLGVAPPADVLDFCCGPGRHALALAQKGYRVTGVDRTAPLLEIAREKARDNGVSVDWVQEDVRTFRRAEQFDIALSLFTSFGYFENPVEDRTLLENIYASLRPGGKLLMDLSGKEVLAKMFQSRHWRELEDGVLMLEERTLEGGWERIHNRWVLIRDGERYEQRFTLRLYSGVELKALMLAAGFSSVNLYGDLNGEPYDQNARRLVAVGTK
jgi:SAM-dependent methyltransferase